LAAIWVEWLTCLTFALENDSGEGNGHRSLLLYSMANETPIQAITRMMEQLLEDNPDCFLVEVWIKPTNNVRVAIDADTGVSIEKCVRYNRALYKLVEEAGLFPGGDFSLEVSSPGLDEPLKMHRQYRKNTGRNVEVTTKDGARTEGKLLSVTDTAIVVQETKGKNKKKEVIDHTFLFDSIKTTKIQITF
jgi:ribosome maturation factor RimP